MGQDTTEIDPFGLLYAAKWNVPRAAAHLGVSSEECKQLFREYCTRVWADEAQSNAKNAYKFGPEG